MAKKSKKSGVTEVAKVCSKAISFKCGGCNWEAEVAYYLSNDLEPEYDSEDSSRLVSGLCAQCFLEMIDGKEIVI